MKLFEKKRYLIVFSILAISIFFILKIDINRFSLLLFKQYASELQQYTQKNYWLVFFVYMLFFIGATSCFIPVTILMTIIGGFLFGGLWGALYACSAATIGGSLIFLVVRHLLPDLVYETYTKKFHRFNNAFKKNGACYLLSLQISPITPTFFINLFSGLSDISLWNYMWTAFVGMLPGSCVYAFAGQKLQNIAQIDVFMPPLLFIILFVLSILLLVPLLIKRKK